MNDVDEKIEELIRGVITVRWNTDINDDGFARLLEDAIAGVLVAYKVSRNLGMYFGPPGFESAMEPVLSANYFGGPAVVDPRPDPNYDDHFDHDEE